jgi:hypothetical protein
MPIETSLPERTDRDAGFHHRSDAREGSASPCESTVFHGTVIIRMGPGSLKTLTDFEAPEKRAKSDDPKI